MATDELRKGILPDSIRAGVDRFCERLQNALGDQLVSIVLYGGLAEGEYSPGHSDVNVMVVLKDVSV